MFKQPIFRMHAAEGGASFGGRSKREGPMKLDRLAAVASLKKARRAFRSIDYPNFMQHPHTLLAMNEIAKLETLLGLKTTANRRIRRMMEELEQEFEYIEMNQFNLLLRPHYVDMERILPTLTEKTTMYFVKSMSEMGHVDKAKEIISKLQEASMKEGGNFVINYKEQIRSILQEKQRITIQPVIGKSEEGGIVVIMDVLPVDFVSKDLFVEDYLDEVASELGLPKDHGLVRGELRLAYDAEKAKYFASIGQKEKALQTLSDLEKKAERCEFWFMRRAGLALLKSQALVMMGEMDAALQVGIEHKRQEYIRAKKPVWEGIVGPFGETVVSVVRHHVQEGAKALGYPEST